MNEADSKVPPAWFEALFPDRPHATLGDFSATRRMLPVTVIAVGIGILSGFIALGLLRLIGLFTNLFFFQRWGWDLADPAGHAMGAWVVLAPVAGTLIVGFMARYGSERIRGHGIPEALESILLRGSRVEPRLAVLKPLSAAISIGSGGPFGAEGPIIMTGGAFGSLIAQGFHLTSAERKSLLVAGAAAGMTATFGSPLAAMLLAVELLLLEWKPRSFVPVALACVAAMATRHFLLPTGPLFHVPPHAPFVGVAALLGCIVAGVAAGALSAAMTASVYLFEDLFQKHLRRVHWMWWPAVGGVVIGIGGIICPQALGVGYASIGDLLSGHMVLGAALVLIAVKWTIWSFALGSGTSGGVLAPLLMIGAALGMLEGHLLPEVGPGFWPLVSMGAVLGGTMRSPLTGILFAVEITHDWDAMLPLSVAVVFAHLFTVLALRRSILTEKVSRRGFHISREYSVDPLEVLFAREVMQPEVGAAPAVPPAICHPDETLRTIVYRMAHLGIIDLTVVDRLDPSITLGKVTLQDLLIARRRHLEEETRRERPLPIQYIVAPWLRAGPK
ncbi:MAG TPA: chloride channel protein [Candidatus Acidoferrum sp.]|nr:chloride channel protein [Candidatus Acidoferrum sp.]